MDLLTQDVAQTRNSSVLHRCTEPHPVICVSVNGILNLTPQDDNTPPGP